MDVLDVGSEDLFVDFGSGDGVVLAEAAARGARVVGIEVDPDLVARSRHQLALRFPAAVAARRVRVLHEPIGWRSPAGMTAGFVNLLPFAGGYVVPMLLSAARRGARLGTVDDGFFGAHVPHRRLSLPDPDRGTVPFFVYTVGDQRRQEGSAG